MITVVHRALQIAVLSFAIVVNAGAAPAGVVSHIKVVSSRVEDVSSLEAWKKSFIKEGMSEKEKAMAVWESVVRFQHQDLPPVEFLQAENDVLDPIKMFNVYGYSYCSVASANSLALARYAGLAARGWTINQHVVPEYSWDGAWHLLDGSLITYFPKPDGSLAGVEEIVAGVKEWYVRNPDLKHNDAKLRQIMTGGGWKKGPEILAHSPFYDENGWLPAAAHGWYSTMQEYDGSTLFAYESGYSLGYEVNTQIRHGERLTLNWSNQGLHVNMDQGRAPGCMRAAVGQGELRYTPKYGDLAPGRVGNGRIDYNVPLDGRGLRMAALTMDNVSMHSEDAQGPAIHVKDASHPGTLVLRMPSSYVYLKGELEMNAVIAGGGRVAVLLSDNNGLDWKEVALVLRSGTHDIDLKPYVLRRYDYRLKFVFTGKGTGLESLKVANAIQHSQRPLPALAQGANTITFNAGSTEGTITLEGSTDLKNKSKQLVYTDFHPDSKGLAKDKILLAGPSGEITFPIETPGDMTRLRIGAGYRARDARDGWDVQVSFDGGNTFRTVDRFKGPTVSYGGYVVVPDIPAGIRSARVRFSGTQRNTLMLSNFRISADYREPQGGFDPVRVVYTWEENGQPKMNMHVARQPMETYTIQCASKPVMKSLVLELVE